MKKFLVISLFSLSLCAMPNIPSVKPISQTSQTVSSKEISLKKLCNLVFNTENMLAIIKSQLDQAFIALKLNAAESLKTEIVTKMSGRFNAPETIKSYMNIWDKYFDENEVNQILAFYESPVGKKTLQKMPELTAEGSSIGMRIGQEVMAEFTPKLQALQRQSNSK